MIPIYKRLAPRKVRDLVSLLRYSTHHFYRAPWYLLLDKTYRKRQERMRSLKGTHAGRCVIMGNGPSLNKMDLSVFGEELVWASNRAYLLLDRVDWRPAFWTAVDRRVVPDISCELEDVCRDLPETLFFYPRHFLLSGVLRSAPNTFWINERWMPMHDSTPRFSWNAHEFVAASTTVTITAIQIAIYLGFTDIYLIGCDTSYEIPKSVRRHGMRGNQLTSTADDDPNHFDPRYFGSGRRWHEPQVDRMVKQYGEVKAAIASSSIRILNATVGGDLEVFPRVNYLDVFSR